MVRDARHPPRYLRFRENLGPGRPELCKERASENHLRRYALQYLERSQPTSPPSARSAAQSLNEHQSSLSGCFLDIAPLGRPPLLHVFSEDLQTMRIDMKQWQSR
jgi:hypothetical protein